MIIECNITIHDGVRLFSTDNTDAIAFDVIHAAGITSRTRYYQRVQNGITHIDNAHVKYEVLNSGVVINQIAFFRNEIMSLYDLSNPKLCVIDIVNEYLCNDALSALESCIDGLASDYGISPDYVRDIVSRSTCDEQRYWACKYMDWLTMNYKVKNNETMHYVDKYTNEAEKYNYDIIVRTCFTTC